MIVFTRAIVGTAFKVLFLFSLIFCLELTSSANSFLILASLSASVLLSISN